MRVIESFNDVFLDYIRLHPDLPYWLLVFNLIPLSIFAAIMMFSAVINFGAAFIVQSMAVVLCLAWFLPTVLFCSLAACLAYVTYWRLLSVYSALPSYRKPITTPAIKSLTDIELIGEPSAHAHSKTKVL